MVKELLDLLNNYVLNVFCSGQIQYVQDVCVLRFRTASRLSGRRKFNNPKDLYKSVPMSPIFYYIVCVYIIYCGVIYNIVGKIALFRT
jgi:hypothetical protein